jgi:hypothetical protein
VINAGSLARYGRKAITSGRIADQPMLHGLLAGSRRPGPCLTSVRLNAEDET